MATKANRRQFLGVAAAGAALVGQLGGRTSGAAEEQDWPKLPPVKIRKLYAGTSGGAWPSPKFKAPDEIARYEKLLGEVEKKLGDVQFIGGEQVKNAQEAAKAAADLGDAAGLLVFDLNFDGGGRMAPLVNAGRPTVVFFYPFSGHQWMYYSQWQKAGKRLLVFPTSDYKELERAARLLRVPARMQQTRILVVGHPRGTKAACTPDEVKKRLGCEVAVIPKQRVTEIYNALDAKAVEAEAEGYWLSKAKKIVEPTREAIVHSARLYPALKKLMIEERAQAVTSSHCMDMPAKGCLAFSKLNDLGYVGACEGDMDSTLTMLLFRYAFGVPGFITDPMFDFAKNAVVHAHCTSVTRLDGPAGERAPFLIRTQCDSEQGVSLEVEMRVGQEITCAKLANNDTILISTGKITEVPDYYDRGCRTQIVTEVRDAKAMFANWGGGVLPNDMMTLLHRVVFYGDRRRDIADLALLMGIKVVEEG
ncbi:MAG TPA: hypothetical protein VNE39_26970 [Planctomycetota bacterium]|nr:hypothetical protein [Planctomycetota bacterium]